MVRIVEASAYLRHQGGGGSEPELIRGSDGATYVVKFWGNNQEPTPTSGRILANEFMSGSIGALIGAPCPEIVIMNVEDAFIRDSPIQYAKGKPPAGPQFGSRYVSDATGTTLNNPNADHIRQFKNHEQIPSLIILDSICKNEDRKIEHIIFHAVTGGQRFYGVDFGHCFAVTRGWTTISPDPSSAPLVALAPLAAAVTEMEWLEHAIERAEQELTESGLDQILSQLPATEWEISPLDMTAVTSFVLAQKNSIRSRVLAHLDQFPLLGRT